MTLLEFLRRELPPDPTSLAETTVTLPDEILDRNAVRFMAGAADGISSHHTAQGDHAAHVASALTHLRAAATAGLPGPPAEVLYRLLVEGPPVLGWVDALIEELPRSGLGVGAVRDVGRWLVRESAEREPLKFGIALCGVTGAGTDPDVLLVGGHEEFTLFVAVAIQRSVADPDLLLLDLARRVHGWGRIHLVERLVSSAHPEVKDWLLRGGYRNAVMDEYVAYVVAERCGLRAALEASEIDDQLRDAAGGLIVALLRGGPAPDIDDYDDGVPVLQRWLEHQRAHALTLSRVGVAAEIRLWLTDPDAEWAERRGRGWTEPVRDALTAMCWNILDQPVVGQMIDEALASEDEQAFAAADHVAGLLGIDTFERHLAVLDRNPLRTYSWYQALRQADDGRIDAVVSLAEARLPLEAVSTGPDQLLGLGAGFEAHACLDAIVQSLDRYPGKGWPLVQAALGSPVIRNRNMALNALGAWDRATWPPDARQALQQAVAAEPDDDIRERMRALLEEGR